MKRFERKILTFLLLFILPLFYFKWSFRNQIFQSSSDIKDKTEVALVLGAGLKKANEPSLVLADRVVTAVNLLKEGKVQKLLLSGKKIPYYDEVKAMKSYALRLGASPDQLLLDEYGFRTIDSCQNAKEIFKLDRVIVISQSFHLPRSLYLCDKLGIKALGLSADISPYPFYGKLKWNIREAFASWKALWDILVLQNKEIDSIS
ncbi:MAG: YdcF family protein [Deltaproteobacteria bacterium]|nr:YdcF family protein [Deltaproteobacteria bacterium]